MSFIVAISALSGCAAIGETPSLKPPNAPLLAPTKAHLESRYTTQASRSLEVDGVQMHYQDQGRGPVLILLPGHLGNLRMFDRWAAELRKDFRVISLDWPPYGLSIADPTGHYSTARATELVLGVMNQMGISSASLIGTSNGATVAAHIASLYPDRVDRLAVSTLPLGPPPPRKLSPELNEQIALHLHNQTYRPASFYREILKGIFADPNKVTDEIVTMYTDMNNNPGGYAAVDEYIRSNREMYKSERLSNLYAKIRVPVLVQWGDGGAVLPPEYAQQAVDAFANAPVVLIQYPNSGHMPMLEEPELTVRDLIAFLKHDLDGQARSPE